MIKNEKKVGYYDPALVKVRATVHGNASDNFLYAFIGQTCVGYVFRTQEKTKIDGFDAIKFVWHHNLIDREGFPDAQTAIQNLIRAFSYEAAKEKIVDLDDSLRKIR